MKALLSSCALALVGGAFLIPGSVSAAPYGAAGCGLGSMVFADAPGIVQVFAATTNGTVANQTFGITSGTSNCGGGMQAALVQESFVAINGSSLSRDAAAGSGEYLSTFQLLMGCEAGATEDFASTLKDNHASIFTPEAEPAQVLTNVRTALASNEKLVQTCKL